MCNYIRSRFLSLYSEDMFFWVVERRYADLLSFFRFFTTPNN
jgi:hypothetical protein